MQTLTHTYPDPDKEEFCFLYFNNINANYVGHCQTAQFTADVILTQMYVDSI